MGNQICGERNYEEDHITIANAKTPGPASKKQEDLIEYNEKHEKSVNTIASAFREKKQKAKEKEDQLNRVKILDKNFAQLGHFITQEEAKEKATKEVNALDKKLGAYQGNQVDKSQISQNLIYKRPFLYELDGSVYHGFWNLNGLREGYGYLIRSDGSKLEGLWKNGEIFKGRIIETDGSYYEGKVKNAEANGEGNLTDSEGVNKYRGNFLNGEYHGFGMKLYKDKANYQGNFVKNELNGTGKLTWSDNSVFEGTFINSVITGTGVYKSKSSNHRYNGEWKYNRPDGKGRYDFTSTGSIHYNGSFLKGKKEGQGLFVDTEKNHRYEGNWSGDKPHGEGIYTSKDLEVNAVWRYGHLVKVITVTKGETPKNLRIEVPEQSFRNLSEKGHLVGTINSPNKDSPSKNYRLANHEKEVLNSLFKSISLSNA